jgi:histidinol-phosphate aminotransferase
MIVARPELKQLQDVPHGGYHSNLPCGDLLDFSSNVNPFGPSPSIWTAMQRVDIKQHPDPRAMSLRWALAAHHRVEPLALLVGNGAVELIYLLVLAYVRPGDRVVVVGPTFGEYAKASTIMGAEVVIHPTIPDHGFALDTDALVTTVQQHSPRIIFLCNPNNPTGTCLERSTIERVLHACPDTLLVLDEAFAAFAPGYDKPIARLLEYPNLLVLRSMTKDYALTGLRVGYAIGPAAIIAALEAVQPPWSVNALAQTAALAALGDKDHMVNTLAALAESNNNLRCILKQHGFAPHPSAVHFFLLTVRSATVAARYLLTRGILVRDCTSFGLPGYIRIASRQDDDNAKLIDTLVACKEELCKERC